jgi:hypothetical protein
LNEAPDYKNELRQTFLLASSNSITDNYSSFRAFRFRFFPFKLNLMIEASLLPHIISALLIRPRNFTRNGEFDRELERINKLTATIIDQVHHLEEIINTLHFAQPIRAAAALALLLHPNGNRDLASMKELLVEFYTPEVGSWYIKVITSCLCLLASEESSDANWIVGNLLEATRTDYESRQCIQKLLSLWRESSYAPVQKASLQEKWLSESR